MDISQVKIGEWYCFLMVDDKGNTEYDYLWKGFAVKKDGKFVILRRQDTNFLHKVPYENVFTLSFYKQNNEAS